MDAEDDAAIERYFAQLEAEDARERRETEESLHFMRHLSTMQLDEREFEALGTHALLPAEDYMDAYLARHAARNKPCALQLSEGDRITPQDRAKDPIKIVNTLSGTVLTMLLENLVYVTYFRDKYTKRRCCFNLAALAILLGQCGIELSTSKFAKITLRHLYGPSHLFFSSGALLETGTYDAAIARKSLNHTMQLLYDVCGYHNIEVGARKCQNIVAKGILDFELCLLVLRDKYPDCVTYKCKQFVGAIIRLRRKRGPASAATLAQQLTREDGGEASSDEEVDDEYECLEVRDTDQLYNSAFAYYDADDARERQTTDAEELAALDVICGEEGASGGGVDDLGLGDAEELDERDLNQVKKKNVTIIVFAKGRIICAGCKTTRGARLACARVLPMLEACRKSDRSNWELEKKLQAREKTRVEPDDAPKKRKRGERRPPVPRKRVKANR